ncbi:MAG: fumarylacetoacetase [Xanthomonadales bacterium]|nr:fumarylacetoacetase [Xanthomonadales bacterium]
MIAANDPELKSWVEVPSASDFPIQNLPFGIFRPVGKTPRVGVAIGHYVLDLHELSKRSFLDRLGFPRACYGSRHLNPLLQVAGKAGMRQLRQRLSDLLNANNDELSSDHSAVAAALYPTEHVDLLMPVRVRDYTDFYASEQHAFNVGSMFRDPDNALLPNWKRLPVGYHGRASSIVVSGVPVRRPNGQSKPPQAEEPVFGPTRRLDFELEMAFVTFQGKAMGESIGIDEADDYIFGLCLFNDWSARDIQAWEYVPLGPFLGKNFGSSISPWIVTLDALEPFRVPSPQQDPEVLPYLQQSGPGHYDIDLDVFIDTGDGHENAVCRSNLKHLYWSMRQQLAHHTVGGCNINVGDMMASGTISATEASGYGSMLELSWNGSKPLTMQDGSERCFIEDGDTVIMRGAGERDGVRVGFGEVRTLVVGNDA